MGRKLGIFLMAAGVALVAAALSLFAYNCVDDTRAGQTSEKVLLELKEDVEEQASQLAAEEISSEIYKADYFPQEGTSTGGLSMEMDTISIDENGYIGYLTLPSLGLELPVMSDWTYELLQTAPCRYAGSPWEDNLVIAAHNYSNHFGRISNLGPGDELYFTDVNGFVFSYEVAFLETLDSTAVEEMVAGEHSLTLFTCTYDGSARVCVRCDRVGSLASIAP